MNLGELKAALEGIGSKYDPESAHIFAAELLLEYIDDPEVQRAFESIRKWYA